MADSSKMHIKNYRHSKLLLVDNHSSRESFDQLESMLPQSSSDQHIATDWYYCTLQVYILGSVVPQGKDLDQ